jgi:hypothetical protein
MLSRWREPDVEYFSVYQFFVNGMNERVREFVPIEEAMAAARHYTSNVAVKMGITTRVIITDTMDRTVFEWKQGEGITWPEEMKGRM